MSRSGYSDDCEYLELWRANVHRTLKSKRGQAFLREMADALDAMPEKRLVRHDLVTPSGDVCAMGAVCTARGLDVSNVDPLEPDQVAGLFGVSTMMAQEIAYENDDIGWVYSEGRWETPEERWTRMRAWVDKHVTP